MVQVIPRASKATLFEIIEHLPEPSSITVYGFGEADFQDPVSKVDFVRQNSVSNVKSPTRQILLDIVNGIENSSKQLKEACFYPEPAQPLRGEWTHRAITIKLSEYELKVEYWSEHNTEYVTELLTKFAKWKDIEILVTRYRTETIY